MLFIKYINWEQLVGIQIYNLDIARIKNQRNEIKYLCWTEWNILEKQGDWIVTRGYFRYLGWYLWVWVVGYNCWWSCAVAGSYFYFVGPAGSAIREGVIWVLVSLWRNTMLLHYEDQLGNSVYSENRTKPIIILRGQSFEMLKQMIRIVIVALQGVN